MVSRLLVPDLPTWEGAACAGHDVNDFFPGPGEIQKAKRAVLVCSTCPIRRACLEYALQYRARDLPGIWGGLTESHRARLRNTHVVNRRK